MKRNKKCWKEAERKKGTDGMKMKDNKEENN